MNELSYLIFLIAFIIGSVLGLLLSYKKHGEAFVINKIDLVSLAVAIIGWTLLLNYGLFAPLLEFIDFSLEIAISIALILVSMVLGMRPGYGRKETAIGVVVAVIIWIISYLII